LIVLKKIAVEKFGDLVSALMKKGPLYAPVKAEGGVEFQEIKSPAAVTLDFYNTTMSPKFVFFPQSEDMIRYKLEKSGAEAEPVPVNAAPSVLLGVRPCDVKSFEIMDRHFKGAGVIDPYWADKREKTTIIGYAFDLDAPPDPADFYNTLGIQAADPGGSDVFMVRKDKEMLLKGITPKGEELLTGVSALADADKKEEKYFEDYVKKGRDVKTRFMDIDQEKVARKLVEVFDNKDFWERASSACISCGACTFVCPTCYCFDIADETIFRDGARRRFWDACMFTDFTLEASGHNPRPKIFQRYRQKACHKYSYHVDKYGCISCVGCGRCTRSCPVNIDIYSIIEAASKL
jgi:sulfhydrogenase subunit beta (sulfur reductase)